MGIKQIKSGTNPLATDADQFRQALTGAADVGALSLCAAQSTPAAPTATATAVTGNPSGVYYYKVIVITGWQQSDGSYYVNGFAPSADSAQITVSGKVISLTSIPTGSTGTIARAIYRTAAGGSTGTEKYCDIVWDNTTTTYTDNIADSALGTGMPGSTTTPAAYGTGIPASVPIGNTTGTKISALSAIGIVGEIKPYAGSTAPTGALLCDGSAVSRTTYAKLFSVIGTTWGSGDGSTTFNLPNLKGRTLIGAGTATSGTKYNLGASSGEETHTLSIGEMPSHNHEADVYYTGGATGAAKNLYQFTYNTIAGSMFTADTGGGGTHNNMQPYSVINYIIVY